LWCSCRIGVGITASGDMTGTPTSNAVICNPGNLSAVVQQYDIVESSYAGIIPHATPGTWDMGCEQSEGRTVMRWKRNANNGDPNDAQINMYGPTFIMWAIGHTNAMTPDSFPDMNSQPVDMYPSPRYNFSAELTPGLVLYWNVLREMAALSFKAVYSGTAWYGSILLRGTPLRNSKFLWLEWSQVCCGP
jgi:hypothetical protein